MVLTAGDIERVPPVPFWRDGGYVTDHGCNGSSRRVVSATCAQHGGAWGYTNLVVTKKDGEIEFDPHATGACVVRLDEDAARVLFDALREWLG